MRLLRFAFAGIWRLFPRLWLAPNRLSCTIGVSSPGRWGHRSPLPQYRLGKTGVSTAKRRSRKARFWHGNGGGYGRR